MDHDKSGEVTIHEFQHGLYLLILEGWAPLMDEDLGNLILTINAAAKKWYPGHFSWYKVFKAIDTDENDRLEFDEFERIIRANGSQGGLSLKPSEVSLEALQGLWKRLDEDSSGGVSIDEFMHFMKEYYDPMLAYTGPRHRELDDEQKATGKAMTEESLRPLVSVSYTHLTLPTTPYV